MEIPAGKTKIMDAWTEVLEDCDRKEADEIDEDIRIEDENLELDRDRAETTAYPAQNFFTHLEVQLLVAADMEQLTSYPTASVWWYCKRQADQSSTCAI